MQVKLNDLEKIRILNSEDIYSIMQRVLMRERKIDRNKEHFWIVGLSSTNKILYIELISVGTVNATLVEPMEVFSIALQKRTVRVIMVHNHPSGSTRPSEADKDKTDHLLQVGHFLNIPVVEHLIISEKTYYSFADSGLLHTLSKSEKYVMPYKLKEKIRKEALAIGRELGFKEGVEEKTLFFAKVLKERGFAVKEIAALTGLSEAEVKKIKVKKGA